MLYNTGDKVINVLKFNQIIKPIPDSHSKDSIFPVPILAPIIVSVSVHSGEQNHYEYHKMKKLSYKTYITQLWKELESWNFQGNIEAGQSSC